MPAETAQAVCCMIFGGVLERFPRLKVCFAHGGAKVLSAVSSVTVCYIASFCNSLHRTVKYYRAANDKCKKISKRLQSCKR